MAAGRVVTRNCLGNHRTPYALAALAAITAAGAALRLLGLELESLWYDEAISLVLARGPYAEILGNRAHDGHPPLYFLLLRAWTQAFGDSVASIRGLSALFGSLTIPLIYALAARGRGAVTGLLAAGLAAGSAFFVAYSREARDYSLLLLCGTASFLALARALERTSFGRLAAWSGTLALSLWSSGFGFAVLASQILLLVGLAGAARWRGVRPERPLRLVGAWGGAVVVAVLAYLPWMVVLLGSRGAVATRYWAVGRASLTDLGRTLVGFGGTHRGLAVLASLAALGLWREGLSRERLPRRAALLVAWLLGPLLLPWLASQVSYPFFVIRGAIVSVGAFVTLAASGLDALRPRRALFVGGVALAGLAVAFGVQRDVDRVEREDWRGLARTLTARATAGDVVLLRNRYELACFRAYEAPSAFLLVSHEDAPRRDAAWGDARRVWFVESAHTRRAETTRANLVQAGFERAEVITLRKLRLEAWATEPGK